MSPFTARISAAVPTFERSVSVANGWLQWVKAANRVDYSDGTSVWYGCPNGIVELPRAAAVPC